MPSRLINRDCPVCGSSRNTETLRKDGLRLVQCATCSMIYASPMEESLASGEFYDQLATPFYLSPDKLEGDYATVRFERELKLFRRFCKGGHVLDVGCSTGAFLFQLRARFGTNYETLGIDVAGPALDYAESRGVPVLRESFLTSSFGGRHFDAVTFWAVLEHLPEPRAFLRETAAALTPGGVCFILVPNYRSLAVRILGGKYRYILPQHVNYFTASTLSRLVENEPSLRRVHLGFTHFNPLVIAQDWKRGGVTPTESERANLLKRTTDYKKNPAMKPLKMALAAAEGILGGLALADNIVMVLRKAGDQ